MIAHYRRLDASPERYADFRRRLIEFTSRYVVAAQDGERAIESLDSRAKKPLFICRATR